MKTTSLLHVLAAAWCALTAWGYASTSGAADRSTHEDSHRPADALAPGSRPQIVLADGGFVLAWKEGSRYGPLRFARAGADGVLGPMHTISSKPVGDFALANEPGTGRIAVAWTSGPGVWFAFVLPDGTTTSPTLVTAESADCVRLASGPSAMGVAWGRASPRLARVSTEGLTIGAEVVLPVPAGATDCVSLAGTPEGWAFAYGEKLSAGYPGRGRVALGRVGAAGELDADVLVLGDAAPDATPAIAFGGGRLAVVWPVGFGALSFRCFGDGCAAEPVSIPPIGYTLRRPALTPRPGGWALAWHDTRVDMSGIALAFLDPDGGLATRAHLVAFGRRIGSFAVAEAGARVALAAFELWSSDDPAGKDLVRGTPFLTWFDASGAEVGTLDLRLP